MGYLTRSPSELHRTLSANHERLERLFDAVLRGIETEGCEAIRATWDRLDEELRAHLCAEAEFLLPAFELQSSAEAARVRAEHNQIRRELQQLEIDLDLHQVDQKRAERFIQLLRDHLSRNEREFYPWADTRLPRRVRSSVMDRLRRAHRDSAPWSFSPEDRESHA